MSNYLITDTDMTSVADAIRTKGGTSASLAFPTGFVNAINDIPSGSGTVTITLSQMTNAFDQPYIFPSSATVETDPDSPWITYIRNLPTNSLIVFFASMSLSPTCSTGITYAEYSIGARPARNMYAFTIGDTDGSIEI